MKQTYHTILFFTFCLLFFACQRTTEGISPEELAKRDSLALHVGVMPVMECFPIYYAQKMGFFTEEGVDVSLKEYLSQMDCDTAMQNKRVEVGYGDLIRALQMTEEIDVIAELQGRMSLVTARSKRIRQLKHLNERMVGLDRLSTSDYWSDKLMERAALEQTAIYRPQINDVQLRTFMLTEQLLDAAILPEPYASVAARKGNRQLFSTNDSTPSFACLTVARQTLSDTTRVGQIQRFLNAYSKAVDELNGSTRNEDSIRNILQNNYALEASVADSLPWPTFHHVRKPKAENVDIALQWLRKRERNISSKRRDSLICNRFVR